MKPGDIVGFRYQVKSLLGKGSFCEVWSAIHTHTRAEYAVKTVASSNESTAAQLANERLILSSLSDCTNIITLHSHFSTGGCLFLMLDKAETSLDKLTGFTNVAGLLGIHRALSFMHAKGILHRDVKPANVLVVTDDRLVLCDFGLSGPPVLTPCKTKNLVGTKTFASRRASSLWQNTKFDDIESFLYTILAVVHYSGKGITSYSELALSTDEIPGELVAAVSYVRLPGGKLPDLSALGFVEKQLHIYAERVGGGLLT